MDVADMTGKTVVITGGNSGIGLETAVALAQAGAKTVITARDRARGEAAVAQIRARSGRDDVDLVVFDLASIASIHEGAAAILARCDRIDVLVNNAGLVLSDRRETEDGFEATFGVNHLGPFVLTDLLLDRIKHSAPARIVNVSSLGQQAIDFDDVMLTHGYSGSRAYCQSKLAQILFTIDLARELSGSGVTVNALHPATYMNTTMVRQSGVTPSSSVEQGAEAILKLAVSPELEGESGLYFNGQREARADAQAYDADARQQLKALSIKLTGLSAKDYTSP